MQALINNYTTTAATSSIHEGFETVKVYDLSRIEGVIGTIMFKTPEDEKKLLLNSNHLEILKHIERLEDNWDEEGAKVPDPKAIQQTRALISFMNSTGQPIYNIAPGPRGEIMVDFRKDDKSFEVLFYPNKSNYVTFCSKQEPKQGAFSMDMLPFLITWLNG
jgi:hypothetical protein